MAGGTLEVFQQDYPYGVVTAGGTTTSDATWVVSTQLPFPQANYTGSPPLVFHVADSANPQETIQVNFNNSDGTWFVTRGAENSSQIAHPAGFTIKQVVSGLNGFGSFYQLANLAATSYTTITNSTTATPIASIYVPSNGTQPGGVTGGIQYTLNAFGTMTTGTAAVATGSLLLFWDTATGTAIASIIPSVNGTELLATLVTPVSIESTVSFLNSTQVVGQIQMVWKNAAAAIAVAITEIGVSPSPVTVNGTSGAAQQLALVWKWNTANSSNNISVIGAAYQTQ